MSDLRKAVIRLASENPELREHLLPLLKEAGTAKTAQEGQEFADLLKKKYRGVKYKDGKGSASTGNVKVTFVESSNDPAVHLDFEMNSMKGSPENMMKALAALKDAYKHAG